jgi:hypothetical protein
MNETFVKVLMEDLMLSRDVIFEIFMNKVISVFKLFIKQIYKKEFVKIRKIKNLYMPMCVEEH